ncbi:hypothetical protein SBF1_400003 [Candidatus Desulfosporosinus infrequens]|uniref:Uncharacterized protein n=1 Tax=Candidatus Desulfosporosinus infrequens TaxID=2043169 RepID=A0A2U3L8A2_9FIRM|nr:hypothetical protein SBF1_400003 [Candidatus Desulfosporosinus infrequens]
MKRIQFYPSEELDAKLSAEASELGISVSSLVSYKLNQVYFNNGKADALIPSFPSAYGKVRGEVNEYVKKYLEDKGDISKEFILNEMSKTFSNIDMTSTVIGISKPATLRARMGLTFNQQVIKKEIDNVIRALTETGELKFKYKSALYRIVHTVDEIEDGR